MANSPINLLQELLIKQGYAPVYDYVGTKKDGLYDQFVYRVQCKKFNAEGSGNTKKEAKKNAAEKMLLLLAQYNEISISSAVAFKNVQISTPTKICEPISSSRMETQSSPNVNYAGQSSPNVNYAGQSSPNVNYTGQSSPNVNYAGQSSPNVNYAGQSSPNVNYAGQSSPNVNYAGQSSPNVNNVKQSSPNINNVKQSSPNVNNVKQSSSNVNNVKQSSPNVNNIKQSRPSINYVGLLQEFCVQQKLSVQVLYKVVDDSGPAHMKTFTIEASVGSLHAKGTAQCKRIAKQEAANKLLQLLHPNINKEENKLNSKQLTKKELEDTIRKLGVDIKESVIDKPKLPVVHNSKKEQELYRKYTHKEHKVTGSGFSLQNIHNTFEETYSSKISYNIRKKIKTVRDTSTNDAYIIEEVVQAIQNALNVKIEKGTLPSLSKENYLIYLRLSSRPIIAQCGIGKTKRIAEIQAMYNIIVTISTLLNIS
ncbi:protein PF14_0175-like isoform X3 [Nylanderia fulva]|uniref:protein PF14_0175-like isoform X2 n=1 Tax=Nylanderia fulva TaxID=613905 RepID=UPI0010FB8FB8|nr:protein PF14_0175-like isoform X2 [Nylanderia fulva]XP_029168746.1 protein PF14_0175-like isoform X3 [Nylanderia fulva]